MSTRANETSVSGGELKTEAVANDIETTTKHCQKVRDWTASNSLRRSEIAVSYYAESAILRQHGISPPLLLSTSKILRYV
jgi:hypothetical protein